MSRSAAAFLLEDQTVEPWRGRLTRDGVNFVQNGSIWKMRGLTAFTVLQDHLEGQELKLDAYDQWSRSLGATFWRFFGMWRVTDFSPLTEPHYYDGFDGLLTRLALRGLGAHVVAFCDQTSDSDIRMLPGQQREHLGKVVEICRAHDNVLLELSNEDFKNGWVSQQFSAADVSGVLTTRSSWADNAEAGPAQYGPVLDWTTQHTPRGPEWQRKAKDLYETSRSYWKTGVPPIAGEPTGISDLYDPGRRSPVPREHADYQALCQLFGAGGVVHGEFHTLQRCIVPQKGGAAWNCAEAVAEVWRAGIPADAASDGRYTRGGLADCPLLHSDLTLRTYAMIQGRKATAVVVDPKPGFAYEAAPPWHIASIAGPHGQIVFLEQ